MDNRTWTPWYYEYPGYNEWHKLIWERDQARRVARALYAVYLLMKDIDLDATEEYAAYEALANARRVLAEEAK